MVEEFNDPNVKDYNQGMLEAFLNTLEVVAAFWYAGPLNDTHTRSLFSANLKTIRKDDCIMDYIKKTQQKNPRTFFYLRTLLRKSEEWDSFPA